MIRPLLEYPVIPIALASNAQMTKIQRIQNRNIRFIVKGNQEYNDKNLEEIHELLELEPVNVRLHRRLEKLWEKVENQEEELFQTTIMENLVDAPDHLWWRRASSRINEGEPPPIYS